MKNFTDSTTQARYTAQAKIDADLHAKLVRSLKAAGSDYGHRVAIYRAYNRAHLQATIDWR